MRTVLDARHWWTRLEHHGKPYGAPVIALSRKSGVEHRAILERLTDLVIVDEERLKAANLTAAPFVMIVDQDLKVRYKAVLPDLKYAIDTWRSVNGGPHDEADGAPPVSQRSQLQTPEGSRS